MKAEPIGPASDLSKERERKRAARGESVSIA